MIEENDSRELYCRMLGHMLNFHYCRTMKEGLPCGKIRDCWFSSISVDDFLDAHYDAEEKKLIFSEPKSRLQMILESAQRAREREKQD